AELNQLVNQRFLLATLGVTVYGVVTAWLLPKTGTFDAGNTVIVLAGTSLLLVLLLTLYLLGFFLKGVIRVLSTYLIATETSAWEKDFRRFRKDGWFGYTRAYAFLFLVLGLLGVGFPILLWVTAGLTPTDPFQRTLLLVMCVIAAVYFILVIGIGFGDWWDPEKKAERRWQSLQS
ncbi:MAG: hypothetical protein ACRD3M_16655, partial [Thermoanaerobaculia bacterium]